jgi:hypothetical protein
MPISIFIRHCYQGIVLCCAVPMLQRIEIFSWWDVTDVTRVHHIFGFPYQIMYMYATIFAIMYEIPGLGVVEKRTARSLIQNRIPLSSCVHVRCCNERTPPRDVVDVVTSAWAGGSMVRFPAGARTSSPQNFQARLWGLRSLLFSGYRRLCLWG